MVLMNSVANIFGLDIGDRTFKLVQLAKKRRDKGKYRVIAWGEVDVPEGVMVRGDIAKMDEAAVLLAKLMRSASGHTSGQAVVACLPEARTFIKNIRVPAGTSEENMRKTVLKVIEENIPLPAEEIYFDWQTVKPAALAETKAAAPPAEKTETPEPEAPKPDIHVLLGAAPKALVDSYTALIEQAGLAPVAFEIEAMAITRALLTEEDTAGEPVGLLDIGATRSSLAICDRGVIQMTISIPVSGNEITETIADTLSIKWEDAEILKRECGLDANRCEDRMWTILLPLIDDMTEKIRNALRYYKIGFPDGKKIEKLYLCGGGAGFREIDTVLSRKLTIKVRRANALANLREPLPAAFPKEGALTFTTAIGLAMRATEESHKRKHALQIS